MDKNATYGECFSEALEAEIYRGGRVAHIIDLANLYQKLDPAARLSAFRDWLRDASLTCNRCGLPCRPETQDIHEDQEVLCDWCNAPALALNPEPLWGWQRTWLR